MLDIILYDESIRILIYAVSLFIGSIAAEKYIEKKYNPFEDGNENGDDTK